MLHSCPSLVVLVGQELADSCRLVDSNLLIFSLAKECPDGAGKRNGYAHSSGTQHRYGLEIKTSAVAYPGPTGRQDGTLMTLCTGTNTAPVTKPPGSRVTLHPVTQFRTAPLRCPSPVGGLVAISNNLMKYINKV
jgi:hypothetical protein